MTGSLQTKSGKYYIVLYVNGKQKWISTGILVEGNNLRKAQKHMRAVLVDYEEKKIDLDENILFVDYVKLWLEEKKYEVELNTWESYEMYVNSIIEPYFSKRKFKLQDMTPQDIKTFFKYLQKGSPPYVAPHSIESIKKYRVYINGAFKMAMEDSIIAYTPVDRVSLKKSPEAESFKGDFYSGEEANILLDIFETEPMLPAVQLALFYGLRRSEILGLRWTAVDFKNNVIRIERTVVQNKTIVDKKRTKNKKSLRTMPLTDSMKSMLQRLKKEQVANQLLFGNVYKQSDYICRLADGTPLTPNYITHRFRKVLDKNVHKIKPIRFHDLRHTSASLLLAEGYSLHDIKLWLGHESIKSTEIYAHLQAVDKISTAEKMSEIIQVF